MKQSFRFNFKRPKISLLKRTVAGISFCSHFKITGQLNRSRGSSGHMLELFIVSQYWGRPSFTLILRTGDFIGSKTAGFLFVLAAKEDQMIYSPECVPEGFSLSDPDHLPGLGIISLYQHWLEHQKKGLALFIVLNPSPLHGPMFKKSDKAQGKRKEKGRLHGSF